MAGPLDQLPPRNVSDGASTRYRLKLKELEGRIKVGETDAPAHSSQEQLNTAGLTDVVEILMDEPAITREGAHFGTPRFTASCRHAWRQLT